MRFDANTEENINEWLQFHPESKKEIEHLRKDHPHQLKEAFYKNLSFGTGGLRALMGDGTNRINRYTVMRASQALANYILKQPDSSKSVLIGYDTRHHSRYFAEEAAKVFAANAIKVYLFQEVTPVALISFGCRHKKCTAAVMITASHNPSEYNGYKVYWTDGGQVLPPHDKNIVQEMELVKGKNLIKQIENLEDKLIIKMDREIHQAYMEASFYLQHYPKINQEQGRRLKIVYTSLHGTGINLMPHMLSSWGFSHLSLVEEQIKLDGNFSTVKSPNPEETEALEMGVAQLRAESADLLLASDPDADRLAVAVLHKGEVHYLTGNQVACICLKHICEALTQQRRWPKNGVFAKTIGTTELFQAIAESYHRPCVNVLTGFKYIAGKIAEWEQEEEGPHFIFGGEESFGYLLGTHARDKDAIISGALICEVALQAKLQGKTLVDLMHDLYKSYGFFYEKLFSINLEETADNQIFIREKMANLRHHPPLAIANQQVLFCEDYLTGTCLDLKNQASKKLNLPASDVLLFRLADQSKIMVRPSGTEPKIKIYCGVMSNKQSTEEAQQESQERTELLSKIIMQNFTG